MKNNLDWQLMEALKYGGGLTKEELSDLVKVASTLVEEMGGGETAKVGGEHEGYWWWRYGIPAILGIAFETILDQRGIEKLVSVINKNQNIRAAVESLQISPVTIQEPEPQPWKVVGKLGGKVKE